MFLEVQNNTNDLYLILCGVVVAAEPLVRGLRKLPEDIDWSYSGLYELFPVQGERILSDMCVVMCALPQIQQSFTIILHDLTGSGRMVLLENLKYKGALFFAFKMFPKTGRTGNRAIKLVNTCLNSLNITGPEGNIC